MKQPEEPEDMEEEVCLFSGEHKGREGVSETECGRQHGTSCCRKAMKKRKSRPRDKTAKNESSTQTVIRNVTKKQKAQCFTCEEKSQGPPTDELMEKG